MSKTLVAVVKGKNIDEQVRRAISFIGGMERFIHPGDTVLIKPNLTGPMTFETGVTTNPAVVEALVHLVQEVGAGKVIIGDGTGSIHIGTKRIFELSGLAHVAEKYGCFLLDLNLDQREIVKIPKHFVLDELDVIS